MPSTFLYSNSAPDMNALESQLLAADRAGYTVDLRNAFWERASPSMSALERPQLRALIQRMVPGDTVVAMHLSCLGRSVQDILSTIMKFRKVGVGLYCVQLGRADLARNAPPAPVILLQAIAALDEATRSERMRASAANAKAKGKQLGRRPTQTKARQQAILQTLANGTSVSETARRFETSRQTVLRIRAAHASQGNAANPSAVIGASAVEHPTESSACADGPGTV